MVFKNLLRRKGRTALTITGISIGVAAIIALGTLANGLDEGYGSMLKGSKADLVLSQPDSLDITYSSLEEGYIQELEAMPEVSDVTGMLQGFVPAEGSLYFFVFGYPEGSFVLERFNVIEGMSFSDTAARRQRGKPVLIGSSASEMLEKGVGDTVRLGDTAYRVIGIYETGDAFEDSGAVLPLEEAQLVLGKPRQVSLIYIQLQEPELAERFELRVTRRWDDLALSTTDDFADSQLLGDMLQGYVWAIAGLAILIGGVGMANSQLMAVFERTREIGVLRAVGWNKNRVMLLILGESVVVGLLGGLLGVLLGWFMLYLTADAIQVFGAEASQITPGLLGQALLTVLILGVVGGVYPAWRASRLQPLEALRYEGGTSSAKVRRLPFGGMAVQSLWQRSGRSVLTLVAIGLTVGAIMALEGVLQGTADMMTNMATESGNEIMIREADVSDTSLSAIDERIGSRIEALAGVRNASGMIMTALLDQEEGSFLILLGYSPNEHSIKRFNIVEGDTLRGNHQIIIGSVLAEATGRSVGDTMAVSGSRFRVVGIFETGTGWEEMGGVVTLRDAQVLAGRPNKVTMYGVKLEDPERAPELVKQINEQFPDVHAALAGEFAEQMPDMQAGEAMLDGISFLAILVGGVGILNTMLMAVFERTREIGVLRTMGWKRRRIVSMIIKESLLLGALGGVVGIGTAFAIAFLLGQIPDFGSAIVARWDLTVFLRASIVALALGLMGGVYPALRASAMQPVEALRYE
jgi:putative ABC transport system permease protein